MQEDAEKLVTTKDLTKVKDELKAEIKTEVTALSQRIDQLDEKLTKRIDELEDRSTKRMDRFEAHLAKTDQTVERMAIRIVQMEQTMETLETKADAQRKHDEVMNGFDRIMKRLDISDSERAAGEYTFRQHEAKIENHEKRLLLLEQKA